MSTAINTYLALDVGERRIGVALANDVAKIASPLTVIQNDEQVFDTIKTLITKHNIQTLVVGLPRSLSGNATDQTDYVTSFCGQLRDVIDVPIVMQDEALTSKQAETELKARGKKYEKGEIDSLAAVYILEDYLASISGVEKLQ